MGDSPLNHVEKSGICFRILYYERMNEDQNALKKQSRIRRGELVSGTFTIIFALLAFYPPALSYLCRGSEVGSGCGDFMLLFMPLAFISAIIFFFFFLGSLFSGYKK